MHMVMMRVRGMRSKEKLGPDWALWFGLDGVGKERKRYSPLGQKLCRGDKHIECSCEEPQPECNGRDPPHVIHLSDRRHTPAR